ncbi:MAG TPA: NAD-dependent epimerase/dehydratase family protein [Thermodesulfobacteriota bacterium]
MAQERVLVTGGTGFTGSHLTRRLLERGYRVVVLDASPGRVYDELTRLGAEIHIGSVADRDLVRRLTEGCTVVHHLAAMFRQVNAPKAAYWAVNVEGTRNLLDAAIEHGVRRFVYCSTCGVHGNVERPPADETAPIHPEDYYQYTKWEGERVVERYRGRGMGIVTLRPAAIYGPGDPERFYHLFRMVQSGRFFMFGDGETTYHPLFIDNLVDAFELAQTRAHADGEVYLVADDRWWTLNDLVKAIGRALGVKVRIRHLPFGPLWLAALACETVYKPLPKEPPLFRRRVDWFRQNRAFSIARARRELGYEPRVPLDEGLARTAAWYRRVGLLN